MELFDQISINSLSKKDLLLIIKAWCFDKHGVSRKGIVFYKTNFFQIIWVELKQIVLAGEVR